MKINKDDSLHEQEPAKLEHGLPGTIPKNGFFAALLS